MKEEKKKFNVWIIFKILFLCLAAVFLLIAGIILFKANVNPDKVPDVFGYKPMIVLSGSMETSIYAGDLVFVKMVDTSTLKENDVIAFRNEEDTVTTHRIIEKVLENNKIYFKTKGDNNNTEDANLVAMEDVEGLYVFRIAGLGNALIFMQKPMGLVIILLVILVVGLLVLYLLNKKDEKKFAKEMEQEKEEYEEFKRMKAEKAKKEEK